MAEEHKNGEKEDVMFTKRSIIFWLTVITSSAGIFAAVLTMISIHQNKPAPVPQAALAPPITISPQINVSTPPATAITTSAASTSPQVTTDLPQQRDVVNNRKSGRKASRNSARVDQNQAVSWSVKEKVAIDSVAGIIQNARKTANELNRGVDQYRQLKGREAAFEIPIKEHALERILADISFLEKHQKRLLSVASNDPELQQALETIPLKRYYSDELSQLRK